jgi:hypothetical protein
MTGCTEDGRVPKEAGDVDWLHFTIAIRIGSGQGAAWPAQDRVRAGEYRRQAKLAHASCLGHFHAYQTVNTLKKSPTTIKNLS